MAPKPPSSFKDLWVWQRSVAHVLAIYQITKHVPYPDPSGVVRQLRRAAISIPARIARGVGIGRHRDYVRCLLAAYGFTLEIETGLHMARELGLVSQQSTAAALLTNDEIAQMLISMLTAMQMPQEFES
jgi:four helix bundle protein